MGQQSQPDVGCEFRAIALDLATLIRMVEAEQPCCQILCKLTSIRKTLCDLKHALMAYQIRKSIYVLQYQHEIQTQVQDLLKEKIQSQ